MHIRKGFFITLALAAILVILAGCSGQGYPFSLASESLLPDFLGDDPPGVSEAYRFAIASPHELEKYPCYCGCGAMGHTSNLSCYISEMDDVGKVVSFDDHAAGCGICVDITQD